MNPRISVNESAASQPNVESNTAAWQNWIEERSNEFSATDAQAQDGEELTGRALMMYRESHGGKNPPKPVRDAAGNVLQGRDLFMHRMANGGGERP